MKKIGIVTFWGNNNPGTFLQCFATQKILNTLGYTGYLICLKESLFMRIIRKLWRESVYYFRVLRNFKYRKEVLNRRKKARDSAKKSNIDAKEFNNCFIENINYILINNKNLKRIANSSEYIAFLSGSDQIWNPSGMYINSFFFLRFAPKNKRIAFAPSFGVSEVPEFNKKVIKRYVSDYNHLSVRESSGAEIIKKLTGLNAPIILDPVLHLSKETWRELTKDLSKSKTSQNKYLLLLYFLDEPSDLVFKVIKSLLKKDQYEIVAFQFDYEAFKCFNGHTISKGNPMNFVNLIDNAYIVFTDSFHATAFSVLMNSRFFVFPRQYGHGFSQSGRIESFLEIVGFEYRFILSEDDCTNAINDSDKLLDFTHSDDVLKRESVKAIEYLENAINQVEFGGA